MFWENQREKLLLEEKFFTKKKTQYDVQGKNIHCPKKRKRMIRRTRTHQENPSSEQTN